ncbi:50S ribosomal protein L18 [Staphylococcus massiliensis]|uniref:Large ribosomal subunit protein uL18 n=1 Tax=Staphylococcus massiliensis S46 TaxID=1229783 RepID=K9ANR2_9STAP|nr:50S ribosomal protein L18 [Staphylococcus massiliensis]EKU48914.1 50S ribosomal protein L18 [Staphylococcus massiliensis S46]MCG3399354.1 50S ribosomal protein L18 [Staphylococcus massiliensis]MCG3402545.1 50S ribosomal protein L18 [Staphylococcus massiliensis]MCG3411491.1 50S ribosomal protein L18 [Staphylococcus massiliensis]PNZ98803.1 50S ribosomal protein L18 [Staphylococcus massiliensis CCUG 55927]
MISKIDKNKVRLKRHARVRSKLNGTAEKPRLNVYRSNKHIYAQIIDDIKGVTLVQASTQDKDVASESATKVELASKVGEMVAKKATEKNITEVVFDRGGYLYHGRVEALANAARENGLQF